MIKTSKIPEKNRNQRILTLIVLLLILAGFCIYYSENFMMHQEYATQSVIAKNYSPGNLVVVSGSITKIFPDGFQLLDSYKTNFTIYSAQKVNIGDRAEVYGLLGTDYQIKAEKINIVPLWSYQFVMIRSFIAFLVLAFIFNLYWKFNPKKGLFIRKNREK